ncbi:MAG: polysaccharide biosynthesis C-terminal domain-containing protein [Candidatus Omnitrophota bacterium]
MTESKSKRLVTGSMLGALSFLTNALIALFMTPFLIGRLGDRMYGLWMVLASFTGFYGLLDLGLGQAVQRFLARALGLNDKDEARYVINSSLVVFSIIGGIAFIISVILALTGGLFVKDPVDLVLFRKLVIMVGFGLSAGFPMRTFWGIFTSHLRYDIAAYIESGKVIVRTIVAVIVLKMGYKLFAFALIIFISDMAAYVIAVTAALRVADYLDFSLKYFKWTEVKKLFSFSVFSFISQIANTIKFSINNLVIAAALQLTAVTLYSIGSRLMFYFMQFMSSSIALMMPVFTQYEAQGNFAEMRRQLMFVTKISSYLGCFIGFILIFLGKPFIERWVGLEYIQSYRVIMILVIPLMLGLIQTPGSQVLVGIFKHRFLAFLNLGDAAVNLILSLILVRYWGIFGVAAGTAIPMFIAACLIKPPYLCKQIGLPTGLYYREIIMAVTRSFLIMSAVFFMIRPMIRPDYTQLFFCGLVFGGLYFPAVFFTGFRKNEREYLFGVFRRMAVRA